MPQAPRTWVVRAGKDSAHFEDFRSGSFVAIGWAKAGPIEADADDDSMTQLFDRTFANAKPGARRVWQAQVRRFLKELAPGDAVATYDNTERVYLLGRITGPPTWQGGDLPRVRAVEWTHHTRRDSLTPSTRNGLGSIATLFRASQEVSDELWQQAQPLDQPLVAVSLSATEPSREAEGNELQPPELGADIREKSEQFIEDRIVRLDWQDMQELVAGILRAMGYVATVAAEGSDRGVDIFASPDGLGLQEPRIFVEVKHRNGSMGADELRKFLGGRRSADRCLYVSTGGFTKEARYEADRATVPLTLITLPRLRELLLQHYERLDPEARALVPLQRLYWPID